MNLIESARGNDLETLKTLIAGGANVNAVDEYGRTALWWAAFKGHIKCAAALIDAKADVDKADQEGEMPLHRASNYGRVEAVRLLLQHKANVNALDKDGSSPLHHASASGHLTCVQILVAAGAEKDRPENEGYTPLAYAILGNLGNAAEYLLHSGSKMKNVPPATKLPGWMNTIIAKRQLIMSFTLALKGLLRRRLALSKDATHLIALYFWRMRLK